MKLSEEQPPETPGNNIEDGSVSTETNNPNGSPEKESLSPEKELAKLKSEYLYLRAEFDNFRKQAIKERSDLLKYGAERFVVQIIRVLDNFDLALETDVNANNFKDFVNGIDMTASEFKSILKEMGVTEVDPLGCPFDPTMHEALSSEATLDFEPGHVCRVFKKAYKLHDKVIRPAQVVVAKEPTDSASEGFDNQDNPEEHN